MRAIRRLLRGVVPYPPLAELRDALRDGDHAAAEALISRSGVAPDDLDRETGATPLHLAAEYKSPALAKRLLEGKADPNARDESGATPLLLAARAGDAGTAALLLDAGARPDEPDALGTTPLLAAIDAGNALLAALLLDRGADPDRPERAPDGDGSGEPPLIAAVACEAGDVVRLLLGAGANVGARDELGRTALHHAADFGDADSVKVLLKAGARADVPDAAGDTPLTLAQKAVEDDPSDPDARKVLLLISKPGSDGAGAGGVGELPYGTDPSATL